VCVHQTVSLIPQLITQIASKDSPRKSLNSIYLTGVGNILMQRIFTHGVGSQSINAQVREDNLRTS